MFCKRKRKRLETLEEVAAEKERVIEKDRPFSVMFCRRKRKRPETPEEVAAAEKEHVIEKERQYRLWACRIAILCRVEVHEQAFLHVKLPYRDTPLSRALSPLGEPPHRWWCVWSLEKWKTLVFVDSLTHEDVDDMNSSRLSNGSQGEIFTVRLSNEPTGRPARHVLKTVSSPKRPNETLGKQFLCESHIYSHTAHHPRVAHCQDVFLQPETGRPVVLLERYKASLDHYIKKSYSLYARLRIACTILWDIAHVLMYLHTHGLVHRDVKPHNILVREDLLTKQPEAFFLCDYGVSTCFPPLEPDLHIEGRTPISNNVNSEGPQAHQAKTSQYIMTFQGTPLYMAPEISLRPGKHSVPSTYTNGTSNVQREEFRFDQEHQIVNPWKTHLTDQKVFSDSDWHTCDYAECNVSDDAMRRCPHIICKTYGPSADMYSLGAAVVQFLTGATVALREKETWREIFYNWFHTLEWDEECLLMLDILHVTLRTLLNPESNSRPSAHAVVCYLRHHGILSTLACPCTRVGSSCFTTNTEVLELYKDIQENEWHWFRPLSGVVHTIPPDFGQKILSTKLDLIHQIGANIYPLTRANSSRMPIQPAELDLVHQRGANIYPLTRANSSRMPIQPTVWDTTVALAYKVYRTTHLPVLIAACRNKMHCMVLVYAIQALDRVSYLFFDHVWRNDDEMFLLSCMVLVRTLSKMLEHPSPSYSHWTHVFESSGFIKTPERWQPVVFYGLQRTLLMANQFCLFPFLLPRSTLQDADWDTLHTWF